jgi:hypothetical protein
MELNQENFDRLVVAVKSLQEEIKNMQEGKKSGGASELNKYSDDEMQTLKNACTGTESIRGATKKVCIKLIEDGWNTTYAKNRNASSLAKKYQRLIS